MENVKNVIQSVWWGLCRKNPQWTVPKRFVPYLACKTGCLLPRFFWQVLHSAGTLSDSASKPTPASFWIIKKRIMSWTGVVSYYINGDKLHYFLERHMSMCHWLSRPALSFMWCFQYHPGMDNSERSQPSPFMVFKPTAMLTPFVAHVTCAATERLLTRRRMQKIIWQRGRESSAV